LYQLSDANISMYHFARKLFIIEVLHIILNIIMVLFINLMPIQDILGIYIAAFDSTYCILNFMLVYKHGSSEIKANIIKNTLMTP